METEVAKSLVAQHGSLRKAAAAAGVGKSSIVRALVRGTHRPVPMVIAGVPDRTPEAPKKKGLNDFKKIYDKGTVVPAKIRAGLKQLGASHWDDEVSFCRTNGINLADMSTFRQEFMDFIVPTREGKKLWAGSIELANEMRKLL